MYRRGIDGTQEQLETFLAHAEVQTGAGLPVFVKDEFEAFLECGILAYGFLRVRCADCAHEKLVAFSCKRRGFCPSCGTRRMAESAAHLVDEVIPGVMRVAVIIVVHLQAVPVDDAGFLDAIPEFGADFAAAAQAYDGIEQAFALTFKFIGEQFGRLAGHNFQPHGFC